MVIDGTARFRLNQSSAHRSGLLRGLTYATAFRIGSATHLTGDAGSQPVAGGFYTACGRLFVSLSGYVILPGVQSDATHADRGTVGIHLGN
jgi:hypothetical protein